MKQFLIFTLLCLLSFFGYSQNGGQLNENNIVKITYLGFSYGAHTFKVCNKQKCEARIRIKVDQDPATDIQIKADSCVLIDVIKPISTDLLFRAKAETFCVSNPDMGWLEINTLNYVLNLVEGNNITITRGSNKLEMSIVGGILKSSYGMLDYIEHIKVYSILGTIKYDYISFVKKSHRTDLNNYLKTGLNVIEVVIVTDKAPERFIFKYMK